MSSYSLQAPAGTNVGQMLQFAPRTVVVSNYSPYFIYFPDGQNFCPPWSGNVTIPLSHATQARATWGTTPWDAPEVVTASPTPNITYTAYYVFTDDDLGYSGGTSINNPYESSYETSGSTTPDPDVNYSTYFPATTVFPQYSIPLYFADAGYNENYSFITQRQLAYVESGVTSITAAASQAFFTPGGVSASYQRLLFLDVSVEAAGVAAVQAQFDSSVWGQGIGAAFLSVGKVHRFTYEPNGFFLNGGIASTLTALITGTGVLYPLNLYWTVGLGEA